MPLTMVLNNTNMNHVISFTQKLIETYNTGHAREHSYRPALKELFERATELSVVNEPKRSDYGAPDFVFLKGKTVIAYAEAKDINVSLNDIEKSEQMNRYYGYTNIILTNGLDFRFYRNGTKYCDPIIIGTLQKNHIELKETSFQLLTDTISGFIKESKEPIKSGKVLAKVMAGKARRIRDNVKIFLEAENDIRNESLMGVYEVIKKLLLADLDKQKFADMYAQTLVYGLFVARYYDKSAENFPRQEARDLVPASNPFLRHFFDHIAGSSFDPRIEYIVTELCEEFNHADVQAIVHNYYKVDKDSSRDPIIHFYEDFLQEYDSSERKKMGVFYTPLPVVRFIVRAVDDILKKEFNLPQGLADSSKIEIKREVQGNKFKAPIHKVQVLDPATGTGTFLNETILHIKKSFEGQEGRWQSYVNNDLLPRLHGFELMMASYTIAHLKLSSTIKETKAEIKDTRLNVYLTNSLEKEVNEQPNLFSGLIGFGKAITDESLQASKVKNELPIMVIMGNPPYSVSSQNKSDWIQDLIKEYKKDLNERKINLDDDYIKFIRLAESLIEKNGNGIVAMITNNSFIDGITHRQMRKHLLETFDSIYIVDLHGSSKKKETALDGSKDENVFAIQQGVSISILVKKDSKKKGLGTVYYSELYGKQKNKFEALDNATINNLDWSNLDYKEPYYFFVPKDFSTSMEYEKGFKLDELFRVSNSGVKTDRDSLFIDMDKSLLEKRVQKLLSGDYDDGFKNKYRVVDSGSYKLIDKIKNKHFDVNNIQQIQYRPFDYQWIYYDPKLISRPADKVMSHFVNKDNYGLITLRINGENDEFVALTTKMIAEKGSLPRGNYSVFPLYLYTKDGAKISNFEKDITSKITAILNSEPTSEDFFDYIYSILNSPKYRNRYKEFLKIDFPRIPYPKSTDSFGVLVKYGRQLRELHLLESAKFNQLITTYPESGNDKIESGYPKFKNNKVHINEKQYFGNIPEGIWNFYIGGYQPARKWLKDRQERILSSEDLNHYQKIIISLTETERIMKEIDKVL
jgi:predicted helicase